jgi:hypothetical protein
MQELVVPRSIPIVFAISELPPERRKRMGGRQGAALIMQEI